MNGFWRSRHGGGVQAPKLTIPWSDRAGAAQRLASHTGAQGDAVIEKPGFEAIYAQYASFVWRVLRGMGVGESMIQDAVQDVFVVVHRRLPDFDHRHSVKTWLFEITYRVACSARRKKARARLHEPLSDALRTSAAGPQEATERLHSSRLLSDLLARMPDDRRAVLVLADIEGLSAKEISEVAGIPINTVYSRLRRARIELSRALDAHGWRWP
jgi:RNA polymerase sigma-70 factor (ECF subfamily)